MSTGKVVLGALAGLAVGAIAGILFAPKKGSKTRKQIMNKGEDFVDELKSKFDEVYDTLSEKLESTIKEAQEIAHNGQAKFEEAIKNSKKATSDS
jgi:gas vesicle protein